MAKPLDASFPQERENNSSGQQSGGLAVSFKLLLGFYWVVPILCLVIAIDTFLFNHTLQAALPNRPDRWLLYSWLFVWPHIYASQFTLLDREYLQTYRQRLLVGLPVLLGLGWGLSRLGLAGYVLYDLFTIYHVTFQQTGIAHLMRGKSDKTFLAWSWGFFLCFAIAYVGLDRLSLPVMGILLGVGLAVTTFLSWRATLKSSGIGSVYLWANQAMLWMAVACFVLGYPIFCLLIPRVVHDLTAFAFYVVHDHNRNRHQIRNILFRGLQFLKIPPACLGLVLGIGLNLLLQSWVSFTLYPAIFMTIAFQHYYTEGIVWKRHGIHRQSVFFKS